MTNDAQRGCAIIAQRGCATLAQRGLCKIRMGVVQILYGGCANSVWGLRKDCTRKKNDYSLRKNGSAIRARALRMIHGLTHTRRRPRPRRPRRR